MWTDVKNRINEVNDIAKSVGEFFVQIQDTLPYGKMRVKIIDRGMGFYEGYTDVQVIRKRDNCPKGAYAIGKTIEETLEKTVQNFLEIVATEYPEKKKYEVLPEISIKYMEYYDF